jgi:hypothetical protein
MNAGPGRTVRLALTGSSHLASMVAWADGIHWGDGQFAASYSRTFAFLGLLRVNHRTPR